MNICVECKHIKRDNFDQTAQHGCQHPDCRHPVSGRAQLCVEMRKAKSPCGPAGSLWAEGTQGRTLKMVAK